MPAVHRGGLFYCVKVGGAYVDSIFERKAGYGIHRRCGSQKSVVGARMPGVGGACILNSASAGYWLLILVALFKLVVSRKREGFLRETEGDAWGRSRTPYRTARIGSTGGMASAVLRCCVIVQSIGVSRRGCLSPRRPEWMIWYQRIETTRLEAAMEYVKLQRWLRQRGLGGITPVVS